jgi:hypothetical protein
LFITFAAAVTFAVAESVLSPIVNVPAADPGFSVPVITWAETKMFEMNAFVPPATVGFVELVQLVPAPVIVNGVATPSGNEVGETDIDPMFNFLLPWWKT